MASAVARFHSGDAGVIYPDSYLQIRDRFKDIIISGGENISSIAVEVRRAGVTQPQRAVDRPVHRSQRCLTRRMEQLSERGLQVSARAVHRPDRSDCVYGVLRIVFRVFRAL